LYENAAAAKDVTFKQFMQTHIRYYVPGVYKKLVSNWPALESWKNMDYWLEKIGTEYVDGIHYLSDPPFRQFAGGAVMKNQRGEY